MSDEAGTRALRSVVPLHELLALALLASLPVVPYLALALREGVPRFALAGDFALLEQATRHVWRGDAWLGPYSRFHWHHPGPLFFYLVAPFEALFGAASTGLFVGTCAVNAAAAATLVTLVRVCTTRAHAVAAVTVLLAWFAAFGNVTANPWNPLVIVLPLMTYLVACALVSTGESRGLAPAALFGALAASTHVAAVSTVAVAGTLSAIAFARRRPKPLAKAERWRLLTAIAIVVVASTPPLVEQATESPGNLAALAHFFAERPGPSKSLSTAVTNASLATSWLPDRLVGKALPDEGWIAHGMRWDAMPSRVSRTARTMVIVHLVLAIAAIIVAYRRDRPSLTIVAFGVLGEVVALFALRSIVGDDFHYLVFWTTAASSVTWIGIVAAFGSAIATRGAPRHARGVARPALFVSLLAAGCTAAAFQAQWLAKNPAMPGSYPGMRPTMSALHSALAARLRRDGATPVIHLDGAYDLAQGMVLELEKDSIDVRAVERDRWIFTGIRSEALATRPLHVWFSQPALSFANAACLERLTELEGSAVYVSTADVVHCPPMPP